MLLHLPQASGPPLPLLALDHLPAGGGFSFTAINNHQAMLFAGVQQGRGRVSDCYLMDFESMVCPEIIVV